MPGNQISPIGKQCLSRLGAFAAQGVALEDPAHSWSGLRADDGVVVFAIRASCVQVDHLGCRCLLWSPAVEASKSMDRAGDRERLEHCRLAACTGTAEGLLAYGENAAFQVGEVIALLVARVRNQYWAKWGAVTRAERPDRLLVPGARFAEASFAGQRALRAHDGVNNAAA